MILKMRVFLILLLAVVMGGGVASGKEMKARQVMTKHCLGCHELAGYIPADRTGKAWELTVSQMQGLAHGGDYEFSEEEAVCVVKFLGSFPEGQELFLSDEIQPDGGEAEDSPAGTDGGGPESRVLEVELADGVDEIGGAMVAGNSAPIIDWSEFPQTAVSSQSVATATAQVSIAKGTGSQAGKPKKRSFVVRAFSGVRKILRKPSPLPLPSYFALARAMGDAAFGLLCLLVGVGLMQRFFGSGFRRIYILLNALLVLTAVGHALFYIARYGTPDIIWFWLGLLGLALILGEAIGAAVRKSQQHFVVSKVVAAVALGVVVVHWAWR